VRRVDGVPAFMVSRVLRTTQHRLDTRCWVRRAAWINQGRILITGTRTVHPPWHRPPLEHIVFSADLRGSGHFTLRSLPV